jgi:hypothetical protein
MATNTIKWKFFIRLEEYKEINYELFFCYLGTIQYRALYDYAPLRPDEIAISAGDIITVS